MPKKQRAHVIGQHQPANPKAIVYTSVCMVGLPTFTRGEYDAMLDLSRNVAEKAIAELMAGKTLKARKTEFRGPKFFGFDMDMDVEKTQKDMMAHMQNMAKTIVHTKAETGLRVYGVEVVVYSPLFATLVQVEEKANYRIIDPSDQSCKKQAADAKGNVIDFSEETAAMEESVKTIVTAQVLKPQDSNKM